MPCMVRVLSVDQEIADSQLEALHRRKFIVTVIRASPGRGKQSC